MDPRHGCPEIAWSRRVDGGIAALLFVATAATVLWQNSRLTVIWDLSYILENASRMACGQVPYRDFPFPYAPLTFFVQSLVIRIFGRAIWHHAVYAALAGGTATALSFAIVRRLVPTRTAAVLLTLPLVPLGIYSIFPHPFYDPDACLVILALVFVLLRWREPRTRLAAGALAVVPLFVKQNIGLALLVALVLLAAFAREWQLLAGIAAAASVAAALVAVIFGASNYVEWTIRFAAARRLPPLAQLPGIYVDGTLCWWLVCVLGGMALCQARKHASPAPEQLTTGQRPLVNYAGALLAAAPFLWSIVRIFTTDDPLEREVNLLRFWPLLLVAAAVVGVVRLVRDRDLVPLLVVAAVHGAFLSQSTWGSTYGIWPLLALSAAWAFCRMPIVVPMVFAAALVAAGVPYVLHNERLTYVKLDGEEARGSIAALRGMSARGPWIAGFEELVAWSERHIPRSDAILFIPGEDPFYFATGRCPRVPVLMFDHTINPLTPAGIAHAAAARDVRWLIFKERLQLNGTPMEELPLVRSLLSRSYVPVARLRDYEVWHLR